jgi:hypothetical protein
MHFHHFLYSEILHGAPLFIPQGVVIADSQQLVGPDRMTTFTVWTADMEIFVVFT